MYRYREIKTKRYIYINRGTNTKTKEINKIFILKTLDE